MTLIKCLTSYATVLDIHNENNNNSDIIIEYIIFM